MKNIFTTICYSPSKNDDIDKIIEILKHIKNENKNKDIKVLNRPTIIFEIKEDE